MTFCNTRKTGAFIKVKNLMRLFAAACLLTYACMSAAANDGLAASPAADFVYDLNGDGTGVAIKKYTGSAAAVVIPAVIEDFPVTEIGAEAFARSNVTSVAFPDSVVVIQSGNDYEGCFYRCSSLTAVTLPKNMTEIPHYMFYGCTSLKNIRLPEGIRTIGKKAFKYSGLEAITIPSGIESVEREAFQNCSGLKTVEIGNPPPSFSRDVFSDCPSLNLKEKKKLRDAGYDGGF
ncbi:MAG: leucine-rich repeat domain-containing protein [Treponema sp.]